MRKIAHILPSMAIGGVEVAAQRSHAALNAEVDYKVFYVRRKGALQCGQEPVWKLFRYWLRGHWCPDVVITSLWWSHPLGWLLQASGASWAAFFHSSGYAHLVDRLVLQWAWKHAEFRLVDSIATETVMRSASNQSALLVPYVFPTHGPVIAWESRDIDFIWTGRAATVKRVDLLVRFLGLAESYLPKGRAVIAIAGQVPADLAEFARTSRWDIDIRQDLPNADVLSALGRTRFYLLFSDHEGMSMSTVEAVQAGCVAVVRRVGEIASYLDESACISIPDDSAETLGLVARSVVAMAHDSNATETIRERGLAAIRQVPSYSDSLLSALRAMNRSR